MNASIRVNHGARKSISIVLVSRMMYRLDFRSDHYTSEAACIIGNGR